MSVYPFPQQHTRQSIPDLIRQLFHDLSDLIQQHIELTKTEIKEESQRFAKAAVFAVIGLMMAQGVLLFGGACVVAVIASSGQVSVAVSALLVMLMFVALAGIFGGLCMQQIHSAKAILRQARD